MCELKGKGLLFIDCILKFTTIQVPLSSGSPPYALYNLSLNL